MQIITHKGTHQIGGTCIEIREGDQGLLLDFGLPLVNSDGTEFDENRIRRPIEELIKDGILPDIHGLYNDTDCKICGIVLTHAHRDHFGLGHFVKPDIQVFASPITQELIGAIRMFFPDQIDPKRMKTLEAWKSLSVGPFSIKAHPVDHSGPGAIAVEVEAGGKKVFFTGDLRAHGYKYRLFEHIIKRPPKNVDVLLMEGSSLGRDPGEYPFPDEPAVRKALTDEIKDWQGLVLLFCSSQNVDRVVSACHAAENTGREMVIDYYTAFILYLLKDNSKGIRRVLDNSRFLYWPGHGNALSKSNNIPFLGFIKRKNSRIYPDDIKKNPERFLVVAKKNRTLFSLTDDLNPSQIKCIWSMWSGYLSDPNDIFVTFCKDNNIQYRQIHTSGHATIQDLKRLVSAINPKILIPVHTFYPEDYTQFSDASKVKVLNDGEVFEF
jgi:ribonuclease J